MLVVWPFDLLLLGVATEGPPHQLAPERAHQVSQPNRLDARQAVVLCQEETLSHAGIDGESFLAIALFNAVRDSVSRCFACNLLQLWGAQASKREVTHRDIVIHSLGQAR